MRSLLVGLAGLVALAALVASASAANAHGDDGSLEIVGADPREPMAVDYRVRLVYLDDGHPAADATVTVVAEGPDGATVAPVPLDAAGEEGVYAGVVHFPAPGAWTVRLTSLSPEASLERSETLAPATTATPPTTGPPTTGPPTTGPPTTAPPSTAPFTAAPSTTPTTAIDGTAAGDQDDGGGGMNAAALAGAGVAVVALGGIGVAWMRHRRPPA